VKKQLTVCLLLLGMLLIAASPVAAAPPPQSNEVYVVQQGDALYAIARRFDVTAAAITAANNLSNPNLIFVGQRLVIPGVALEVEPAIVTEDDKEESAEPPSAVPEVYVVQPGDTLNSIACQFGDVSPDMIALANDLKSNNVSSGQKLHIP